MNAIGRIDTCIYIQAIYIPGKYHQMFVSCTEIMLAEGNANMAVSDLVKALRPRGRAAVPDDVKAELLTKLRAQIVS